jgi:hypothetical protein
MRQGDCGDVLFTANVALAPLRPEAIFVESDLNHPYENVERFTNVEMPTDV